MKLVTTRNNTLASKFIRWITKEEESHFLFVFDDSLVFHSRFIGTGLEWWNYIKEKNEIIWIAEIPLDLETEEKFYRSFVDKYYGDKYDFGGALYLGLRLILLKVFKIPMPDKNIWSKGGRHFCSELALKPDWDLISQGLKLKMDQFKHDLVTPFKARSILERELTRK